MEKNKIRRSVELAIKNIIYEGCTDVSIFGKPFELKLLKDKELSNQIISDISNNLILIINSNEKIDKLKINKISHILVPKKNFYDFRKCALIDIADEIKYLSIVLLIADNIEKKRLSKNVVFSYRYLPDGKGRLFDKEYNYSAFKNEYKKISSSDQYNVIIECDISNFYDRLNLHRLNSTLLSIKTIDCRISYLIDQLLLYWANRDSYGLPVGSNASRILAEAFLIEIDNYLISKKIKFCRFVDDYRFFAKDVKHANKILSHFITILNKHGLSINVKKTNFRDISKYKKKDSQNKTINKEGLFEIINGYSGLVPTKFRKLSNSEIKKLKHENSETLYNELKNNTIITPDNFIKYIKILIAKEQFDNFITIPNILQKYPQLVPYFSDVLIKTKESISKKKYSIILKEFEKWLNDDDQLEYILISVVILFNATNGFEKKVIFDFFKNLKRNSGIYIARTILVQIGDNLTRGELLELKDYYLRADCWEKRQILYMILNGLDYPENRPFIKDLEINCTDYFIQYMITKYKKNRL